MPADLKPLPCDGSDHSGHQHCRTPPAVAQEADLRVHLARMLEIIDEMPVKEHDRIGIYAIPTINEDIEAAKAALAAQPAPVTVTDAMVRAGQDEFRRITMDETYDSMFRRMITAAIAAMEKP